MFGSHICQARRNAKLSYEEISRFTGIPVISIQKFEKEIIYPSSSQLLKIAKACNVKTVYFFQENINKSNI